MAHRCLSKQVQWTFGSLPILALGESPGENELEEGKGFVGASGAAIWKGFDLAGLSQASELVSRGNAIPCKPPKEANSAWWTEAMDAHSTWFTDSLSNSKANWVLAVGARALFRLFGRSDVGGLRGSLLLRGDQVIVPVIHPAALMHKGMMLGRPASAFKPVMDLDIRRLVNVYKKGAPDYSGLHWNGTPVFNPQGVIAYDIETNAKGIFSINFGSGGEGWAFPWWGTGKTFAKTILSRGSIVGHNTRFDDPRLERVGIDLSNDRHDTIESAAVCWPDLPRSLEFQASLHWRGYCAWKEIERDPFLQEQWRVRLGLSEDFGAWSQVYGCIDGAVTSIVQAGHWNKMGDDGTRKVYLDLHMAIRPALLAMESRGLYVDSKILKTLRDEVSKEKVEAESKTQNYVEVYLKAERAKYDSALEKVVADFNHDLHLVPKCQEHPEYNGKIRRKTCDDCADYHRIVKPIWNQLALDSKPFKDRLKRLWTFNEDGSFKMSDPEWARMFYEFFGLEVELETDGGEPSVKEEALEAIIRKLKPGQEEIKSVLEAKLIIAKSKHALKTPLAPPIDESGYLHVPILSHTTGTGRTSSGQSGEDEDKVEGSKFNIQNINKRFRKIYRPSPEEDSLWVAGDYSQIELWMVALLARDEKMLTLLRSGVSVHAAMGAQIFGIPIEQVKKGTEPYELGKKVGHTVRYGGKKGKVAEETGKPEATCAKWIEGYFELFPRQRDWQGQTVETAMKNRKLVMPTGFTRWFHDVRPYKSKKTGLITYSTSQREEMIATGPQHCAGAIGRQAIKRAYDEGLDVRAFIHDELLTASSEGKWKECASKLKKVMEAPVEWLAYLNDGEPFKPRIDLKVGPNWLDMREVSPSEI